MLGFYLRANTEKTLASQALAGGGAPAANPLISLRFILLAMPRESAYKDHKETQTRKPANDQ